MELPFELYQYHKSRNKAAWKKSGLITTKEEFEAIYNKYIYTSHCELCDKEFKNRRDRQMEHDHENGEFRNIVCRSCNQLKSDVKMKSNNTSGYKGITKQINEKMKQGYTWTFQVIINGKQTLIKTSIDFNKLVDFADKWKKDNNYNT